MPATSESDLLLGGYELTPREREALRRRHAAAVQILRRKQMTDPEALLAAVVWPSDTLRETIELLDEE